MSTLRRRWQVRVAIAASGILAVGTAVAAGGASSASASTGSTGGSPGGGTTREIASSGTASFVAGSSAQPGGTDQFEIPGVSGPLAPDRSHSAGGAPAGAITQPKPVTTSTPDLITSFAGLTHFDQRFGSSAGPNQFSLEPPDQGLCAGSGGNGNTRVLEVIN